MRDIETINRDLRNHRKAMKEAGIKKTSCFNGGMDRETQRANERRFALEVELDNAIAKEDETYDLKGRRKK